MNKIAVILLSISLLVMVAGVGLCQDESVMPDESTVRAPAPVAKVAPSRTGEILLAAKAKLMAKPWTVYLTPSSGPMKAAETDVITFTDMRVKSEMLTAKGFRDSNYSINLEGDVPVWETMQKTKDGELAFLRGELRNDAMSGGITLQPLKGDQIGFGFSTTMPQVAPPAAVTTTPATTQVTTTATTQTTRKVTRSR